MPDNTRDYSPLAQPTADHSGPGETRTYGDATDLPNTVSANASFPEAPPGYELLEEVGHGGMGLVFRARDVAMNRQVAVKLLRDRFTAGSATAKRFSEEAQITGQLQHPAIPPVHEVGALSDGRPYLVMKLIKGRTLAELITARGNPNADRSRFLAIFEQICQGVGYAHAHNIIHRDLKPQNVMVGAFGEVQVMDWGLAKEISATGEPTATGSESQALSTVNVPSTQSEIRIAHATDTQAGSVLGTPAFMPPEQAGGEIHKIDKRADVFGLGAVLCVILTNDPPYLGREAESVRLKAVRGQLAETFTRLDGCGADPELVALCKRCLSVERNNRPNDANEVAIAVAALRAAAEERARQAELERVRAEGERAKAELQATEQRKRRRVQLALAGAVVLLATFGGAFAWWQEKQNTERRIADERAEGERKRLEAERQFEAERNEAERKRIAIETKVTQTRLEAERDAETRNKTEQARTGIQTNLALATGLRKQFKFLEAETALAQAATLTKNAPELEPVVQRAQRDLAMVIALDSVRYRKWLIVQAADGYTAYDGSRAVNQYLGRFVQYGIDPLQGDVGEIAKRFRESDILAELLAALDDWAVWEQTSETRDRLLTVARTVESHPWLDRLRAADKWNEAEYLHQLQSDIDWKTARPGSLTMLAVLMKQRGLDSIPLLTQARTLYPSDFELALVTGVLRIDNKNSPVAHDFEAARALRPNSYAAWNNLGWGCSARAEYREAIFAYKRAADLDAQNLYALINLAEMHSRLGDRAEAGKIYRELFERGEKFPMLFNNYGVFLHSQNDLNGAIEAYKKAIAQDVKFSLAYGNLGLALRAKGDLDGAIAAYQDALRFDRKNVKALNNLGNALRQKGQYDQAITALRRAIELDPENVLALNNLGLTWHNKGDRDEALACYEKALEINPKYAPAHVNIGWLHQTKSEWEPALAAYRKACGYDPKQSVPHYNSASIYLSLRKPDEAIKSLRAAIAANPEYANAHGRLGELLFASGDIPGARAALETATKLDKRWAAKLAQIPAIPVAPPPRERKN
jgi:tetratricopeptide (TPR) repeat protein/serine/threonine protein kinase